MSLVPRVSSVANGEKIEMTKQEQASDQFLFTFPVCLLLLCAVCAMFAANPAPWLMRAVAWLCVVVAWSLSRDKQ